MPKFEPKIIQKEIESGKIWPVYWFFGEEQMKMRELLKRVRKSLFGGDAEKPVPGAFSFQETILDAAEVGVGEVLDAAHTLSLVGGARLVVVKQAHLLKQPEGLASLLGPARKKEEIDSVVVFLSKDLDQRKKFSKLLTEKAACVDCEEIYENDRDAWIQYLAKRRGIELTAEEGTLLRTMDPWSLDILEREVEKLELAAPSDRIGVLLGGAGQSTHSEQFVEDFFTRQLVPSLSQVEGLSAEPEVALPLLGLLNWNARTLGLYLKDQRDRTRELKLGSFLQDKFNRYARLWTLEEVIRLESRLREVDFTLKQTPKLPLGAWSGLVMEFNHL